VKELKMREREVPLGDLAEGRQGEEVIHTEKSRVILCMLTNS